MDKRQRHIKLSWDLIGYKMMYYTPEEVHTSWHQRLDIPDSEYDALEKEYLRLCLELDLENTVAGQTSVDGKEVKGKGMTELDLSRPSVKLAKQKFSKRRFK
jgi:hypothetical protein